MINYAVECGDLTVGVEQVSALKAASYAVENWVNTNNTRLSSLVTVVTDGEEDSLFLTTVLLEGLGIEYDEEDDDENGQIYKPRLCEYTTRPVP